MEANKRTKKAVSLESIVFLAVMGGITWYLASTFGMIKMINTAMNTAYSLLMETVLYIMAITTVTGGIAGLLTEFGVISLANKLLNPLMKPIYGLPGASAIGVMSTYLSDNPAILTLAEDSSYKRYFKKFQLPALANLGTAFGMGLIVTVFVSAIPDPLGRTFVPAAIIGNLGAICGSIVSVRIMLRFTGKAYGVSAMPDLSAQDDTGMDFENIRVIRSGSIFDRMLSAALDGGQEGVKVGLSIIPGVLIICTFVLMLTNGPGEAGVYTGGAYEGVGLLPKIGDKLSFLLTPLFGFRDAAAVAVPITALGAAGAAIGLIPGMVSAGQVSYNEIAVLTAMCMCWSGYLSTHAAMMSALGYQEMTGKAIFSHTIGGLFAGISAHWLYVLYAALFH